VKTYKKKTNNPLSKLPDEIRLELARIVVNNQPTPACFAMIDKPKKHRQSTMKEQVFSFACQVANRFKLPADIRNYLDKASAARLRKYGFKRAITFIESRSESVYAALSVLPEPWFRVDTELKRARLAIELSGRAGFHFQKSVAEGLTPQETIKKMDEFAGVSLWMPQFGFAQDEDCAYSILARLLDESVWHRAIERQCVAAFENARRAAGMVSPHVSPYASYSACEWLKVRQERQRQWLDMMSIESENGDLIDMSDVHQSSQANPENRRHELMTRIAGCQEYADANHHAAVFITMTTPSRFHRLKQRGKYWLENEKFDNSSPREAHEWLSRGWARFRAWADRNEMSYYGMRVVEPHQDGTPHWHGVFFMPLEQVGGFIDGLQAYQCQRDRDELFNEFGAPKRKAMKARFDAKIIDGEQGGAVAYLAKYISKNVDGYGLEGLVDLDNKQARLQDTIRNVTAWARQFHFRQFQFQKTPSVTVWRELRRIQDKQEFCLFEKARRAADMGFFSAYFDYMGGHRLPQNMRPIKPSKEARENKYGESVPVIIGVEGSGISVLTHETKWTLVKKSAAKESLKAGGSLRPWSSGNNCTQPESAENVPSKQQKIIDNYYLYLELDRFGSPEWEECATT
jgi:hypothetical protein